MSNPLRLTTGHQYEVVQPFIDYDGQQHPTGEVWTFVRTCFLPCEDGLTVHVLTENTSVKLVFRLQWRPDEQATIIDHFLEYVAEKAKS